MTLSSIVLDSADAHVLADFYRRLLGWPTVDDEPEWVRLAPTDGGTGLSFQTEPQYVRPTWPTAAGEQQMQLHIDIAVDDLVTAEDLATAAGAVRAKYQPQRNVRVYVDPAGHPFCLFLRG